MKSISEIKEKIKPGDIASAAGVLGITQSNASKALSREGSKHHSKIKEILSKVIDLRERLAVANSEE